MKSENSIISPVEYYDVALVLQFNDKDKLIIYDDKQKWECGKDSLDVLSKIEDVVISYFEEYGLLSIYLYENKTLFIDSSGETLYFFNEVSEAGTLTESNTDAVETYLPDGKLLVSKIHNANGRNICIQGFMDNSEDDPILINDSADDTVLVDDLDSADDAILVDDTVLVDDPDPTEDLVPVDNPVSANTSVTVDNSEAETYETDLGMDTYVLGYQKEKLKSQTNTLRSQYSDIQRELDDLTREHDELSKKIQSAQELISSTKEENDILSAKLEALLEDLDMDRDDLMRYPNDSEIETLVVRVREMSEEVRGVLHERIQVIQKMSDQKHNRIAGGQ